MSKHYKLKKWYPSLPKDIKEGSLVVEKNGYLTNRGDVLSRKEVENNPEFWEKVEEKDYEILSFKLAGCIYEKKQTGVSKGGYFKKGSGFGYDEWVLLNHCNATIRSVKRKSDSEVFTIGDRITSRFTSGINKQVVKIEIDEIFGLILSTKTHDIGIDTVEHAKEPLFTTEDGKEIFEGDSYYFISPQEHWEIRKIIYAEDGLENTHTYGRAYFSTKEKAEEWIEDNKPRYSKKDIERIIDKSIEGCINVWKDNCYVIDLNKVKEQL